MDDSYIKNACSPILSLFIRKNKKALSELQWIDKCNYRMKILRTYILLKFEKEEYCLQMFDILSKKKSCSVSFPKSKKDFLFPQLSQIIRARIKMDYESVYSATDSVSADMMSLILSEGTGKSHVLDACSSIGCNTFSFSKYFDKVTSVEINKERSDMQRDNLDLLGIRGVTHINCDFHDIPKDYIEDLCIFFDPPWGGLSYMDDDRVSLKLSSVDVFDIIGNIREPSMVKCPVNVNYDKLLDLAKENKCIQVLIKKIRKSVVILISFSEDLEKNTLPIKEIISPYVILNQDSISSEAIRKAIA